MGLQRGEKKHTQRRQRQGQLTGGTSCDAFTTPADVWKGGAVGGINATPQRATHMHVHMRTLVHASVYVQYLHLRRLKTFVLWVRR